MNPCNRCKHSQWVPIRIMQPGMNPVLHCRHKIVPLLFDEVRVPVQKMRSDIGVSYCGPEGQHFEAEDDRDAIESANRLFAEACRMVLLGAFGIIVIAWSIAMLVRWVKGG
jgi:hypothetical protein